MTDELVLSKIMIMNRGVVVTINSITGVVHDERALIHYSEFGEKFQALWTIIMYCPENRLLSLWWVLFIKGENDDYRSSK